MGYLDQIMQQRYDLLSKGKKPSKVLMSNNILSKLYKELEETLPPRAKELETGHLFGLPIEITGKDTIVVL